MCNVHIVVCSKLTGSHCHRFRYSQISKWMGTTNETVYITMIRDPVDIFVSSWEYYKLEGNYKMTLRNKLSPSLPSNVLRIL